MPQKSFTLDITIIGGGVIGLSTAMSLSFRFPGRKVLLLEKEPRLAMHQTGHNSGVIHSGIYYQPGSLKAKLCREGAASLIAFCQKQSIPYQISGKVIVATTADELPRLQALYERGVANGVQGLEFIGPERLREIEPHASGIKALHVPGTGIVDFGKVAETYAAIAREKGAQIMTAAPVEGLLRRSDEWILQTPQGEFRSKRLVNCGGLHADRIARIAHADPDATIIPFRGDYYEIVPERAPLVKSLIYPVPNPLFPFLGVHLTRMISGKVEAGPNAVLALKREGYRKTDFSVKDTLALIGYPGFWKMTRRYGAIGLKEWLYSSSKKVFVRAVQRLVPELKSEDFVPGMSGVRAQAVGRDGSLIDDFKIVRERNAIHVLNVPSPAATASLRIGEVIADFIQKETGLSG